jgi:hypothetical protein
MSFISNLTPPIPGAQRSYLGSVSAPRIRDGLEIGHDWMWKRGIGIVLVLEES